MEVGQETSLSTHVGTMKRGAMVSEDRLFRYHLWRQWDAARPVQLWIMFNPSTADAIQDDATVTRLIARSGRSGAGGLIICNLYAYRATNPNDLRKAHYPVGPENDRVLNYAIKEYATHPEIMAGWGMLGHMSLRAKAVTTLVTETYHRPFYCLGTTTDGAPRHPLYVSYDTPAQLWRPAV